MRFIFTPTRQADTIVTGTGKILHATPGKPDTELTGTAAMNGRVVFKGRSP
jgi:hypothetical protein